ncbi:Hypothetical_protein [Hexamita inflata]|uniref:Hypothetical_protein n=1 Tax=Hexamita inflata TaxID=28002 RepID=A0AA86RCS6_9EUKA|nr:Hypothetical protein HINF_LOCUS59261 [Hexamita inflata]
MQPNHEIRSKEDLLSYLDSSLKLEILDLQQMERFSKMNVPSEVWEDASNRNLLSFNQELVQGTQELVFNYRKIDHIYLIAFLTNIVINVVISSFTVSSQFIRFHNVLITRLVMIFPTQNLHIHYTNHFWKVRLKESLFNSL